LVRLGFGNLEQSNMQWTQKNGLENVEEEENKKRQFIQRYAFSKLHSKISDNPSGSIKGKWEVCTPETMEEV